MGTIKNALKKILPPPVNSFMREVNRIVALEEKNQAMMQQILKNIERQEERLKIQEKQLQVQIEEFKQQKIRFDRQNEQCEKSVLGIRKTFEQENHKVMQRLGKIEYTTQLLRGTAKRKIANPILNFEVHLVEHCNLNCKSCDHFSPLASEAYADIEELRRDFEQIAKVTKQNVGRILLLGGEPLLHPYLIPILKMTREIFPYTRISIVSNGLLLQVQKDEFWDVCKNCNIYVEVTKYPIDLDFEHIEKIAQEKGVKFRYFNNASVIKTSWHLPLDLEGRQDPVENFMKCWRPNRCILLSHGRLYTCGLPANVHHFNKYFDKNVPVTEKDSISIYEVNNDREVLDFLCKPIPFCRYCNVSNETTNHPWERSKKDISEWI